MKLILISIVFFLLTHFCGAQDLRIVKDNVNCTYGIKDSTGNWVIQPLYILIRRYNTGYFLVKDALGDGLLSPSGKWIVPCKYDQIEVARPLFTWRFIGDYEHYQTEAVIQHDFVLLAHFGEQKALLNSHGKTICEMSKDDQYVFDGNSHILIQAGSPVTTTYVDTSGTILIDRVPGFIAPYSGRPYSLNGDRWNVGSPNQILGNVRVINRIGEVLFDLKVDRALMLQNTYAVKDGAIRIAFEKNKCFGVMTYLGDTLIPPIYRRKEYLSEPEGSGGSWVIYDTNDRAGLMRQNGTVILEPTYDEITPIHKPNSVIRDAWQIRHNGKIGIMDTSGKLIIPIEYDVLYPVQTKVKNYLAQKDLKWTYLRSENAYSFEKFYDSITPIYSDYSGSNPCVGLIVKLEGKYGVLNPDGSIASQIIYSSYFNRGYSAARKFFSNGKDLSEFDFTRDSIREIKWTSVINDDRIHIYTDSTTYWSFLFSDEKNGFVGRDETHQEFRVENNLFLVHPEAPEDWIIYNRSTKKRIPVKNIVDISPINGTYYKIHTRGRHAGVLDNQGKFIIDTIYYEIGENDYANYIWAAKKVSTESHKWILLDSVGRKVIPNLFDGPFAVNSGNRLISQNQKIGLLDTKTLKWKIRPQQSCLWQFSGDYFYIANAADKRGIISSDGTYAIPPKYDSIVLLCSTGPVYGNYEPPSKAELRCIVYDGGKAFLADQRGNITNESSIRDLQEALLFQDSMRFVLPNFNQSFPVLNYMPRLEESRLVGDVQNRNMRRNLWTNSGLKAIVFDSIHARWEQHLQPTNNTFEFSTSWSDTNQPESEELQKLKKSCHCAQVATRKFDSSRYQLEAIGDNFVSIGIQDVNRNYNWESMGIGQESRPYAEMLNFVSVESTAKSIQLSDIFPSDSVLMSEFITSLKKRDDLKLDCSSLEMMIEMIGGKFTLGTDGVRLHLSQTNINSYGVSEPVTLLIPIENLDNHAESKWIVPILRTFD